MKTTPHAKSAVASAMKTSDDPLEVGLDRRGEECPDLPQEHGKRHASPAIRLTFTDVVNGSVTPRVTSFLSSGSGPMSHSMICSWKANATRNAGTIASRR